MEPMPSEFLLKAILEGRLDDAMACLTAQAERDGYASTISALLEPTLIEVGDLWAQETISLAQGYVAGKLAERVLDAALAAEDAGSLKTSRRGRVVLGNVEDDYHALGRRMVASFLRLDGWEIIDLGNDVEPERFVDAALEAEARIIGVSSMMLSTAQNLPRIRDEIEARGLGGRLRLAAGGAIFRLKPELVKELGADGTAATAIEAPALFRALYEELTP
jgi:methylmalonyl-CoA mutase cobalamin-binding domain/chain